MMFNFFNKPTAKEFNQEVEDTYKVTKPSVPTGHETRDYFRVGITDSGATTLTLTDPSGMCMTLSMTKDTCETLIRMLRATYKHEDE